MFALYFETNVEESCPFWFTKTDSKLFCNYVVWEHLWHTGNDPDVIGMLKDYFNLDIEAILKIASGEFELEEWLVGGYSDSDEASWREQMAANQAAWQSPESLAHCLDEFLQSLKREPDVYSKLSVLEPYFVNGYFEQDLKDLRRMVSWAQSAGASQVRLVME